MATLNTIFRLAFQGGTETRKQLEDIAKGGDAAEKAFAKLDAAGKKVPASLRAVDTAASSVKGQLESVAASTGPLGATLASLGPGGIAAAAGIGALGKVFADSVRFQKEFEKGLANLSAITGATGKDLDFLKQQALDLGRQTGVSATQVVESFKLLASAKPELLASGQALAQVNKEAIALAQAAGIQVPEAGKLLATALNQFGAGADQASRFINVLAAGVKFGAAEIPDLAVALVKAGTEAKGAGLTFEQFNAILQKLAAFGTPAEKIGTSLRNIFLKLQEGARETNPAIVGVTQALQNLAAKQLDITALTKEFGTENVTVVQQLLQVAGGLDAFTGQITATTEAYKQQKTNTDTLEAAQNRLAASYDALLNEITGSTNGWKTVNDEASAFLHTITDIIAKGKEASPEFSGRSLASGVLASVGTAVAGAGSRIAGGAGLLTGLIGNSFSAGFDEFLENWRQVQEEQQRAIEQGARVAESQTLVSDGLGGVAAACSEVDGAITPVNQSLGDHAAGLDTVTEAAGKASAAEREFQAAIDANQKATDNSIGDLAATVQAYRQAAAAGKGLAEAQRAATAAKQEDAAASQFDKAAIAALNKELERLRVGLEATDKARSASKTAGRKAESDAEAAAKRQVALQQTILALQTEADNEAADGVAKLVQARDAAYLKFAEQAQKAKATEEQIAAGNLAIYQKYENSRLALAQSFTDEVERLEIAAADIGVDQADRQARAYQRLVIEREQSLEKLLDLAREKGAEEADIARGVAAVWEKFYRDQARFAEEAFDEEIVKRPILAAFADMSGLGREALKKLYKGGELDAQAFADNLSGIQSDLWKGVGAMGRDALRDLFVNGEIDGRAFWDNFRSMAFEALYDIAAQQIVIPIVAQVVGAIGGGGGGAGGSGGGFGSLLQTGQQILGLGKTLYGGFDMLTGALGASTAASGMLATDIAALAANGITLVPSTAALTASEAAIMFPSGVVPASFGGTGASGLGGAGAAAGAGSIAGAATTAGILVAVIAMIEAIMGVHAVGKGRDAAFSQADTRKMFMSSFDPFTKAIANFTAMLAGMGTWGLGNNPGGGKGAENMFGAIQGLYFGGASGMDIARLGLSLSSPLGPMLLPLFAMAAFTKPPTKGTALRKGFEEWVENGPEGQDGFGFFGRDSGTFKRGIGQTGLSANNVSGSDILADRRASIGQGARGIADAKGIDFVEAQKEFIQLQKESIGLTDEQLKQVTGLGAAFRALVGGEAGEEETRTFGLIADFLGSINAEGADAAETMDIVAQAVASLGRPDLVFQKLNEFFLSDDNDIQVETYRDAIQGLAAALFQDLPLGVDAAAIALRELEEAGNGKVTFEQIKEQVEAAVAEAQALGPALQDAFSAGLFDLELDEIEFADSIFDSLYDGLKETIAQAAFEGFDDGIFKGDILGPFLATFNDTIGKVRSGEISQEDANVILADAAKKARTDLETLRPVILQAVESGRDLAAVFDDLADAGDEAADALKDSFEQSIDRQILGILSPDLAAQYDLEVQQRNRLKAAREAGADLSKVEFLNGLEREALAEQQAEQRLEIERNAEEQITRIREQFLAQAERAIEAVGDKFKAFTQTPSAAVTPEAALAAAQAEFDRLASSARGGNLDAIEDLPAAADTLAALITSLFGSTGQAAALLEPLFATLAEIAGLDPGSVKLSEDAEAQIAAINADRDAQLAQAEKHHAVAVAIYEAMLADLDKLVGKGGETPADQGTLNGDLITKGVPGPEGPAPGGGNGGGDDGVRGNDGTRGNQPSTGRYGLGTDAQRQWQATLAGLVPGGDTEQLLQNLLGVGTFQEIQALGQGTGAAADIIQAILQSFTGVRSLGGFHDVVEASLAKIRNPRVFQPVLGFDTGGSFRLNGSGGPDSIPLLAGVRVSPRETVTVTTHGMDAKLSEVVAELRRANQKNDRLEARLASIDSELAAMRGQQQRAQDRRNAVGARS